MKRRSNLLTRSVLLLLILAAGSSGATASAQEQRHCRSAHGFLVDEVSMIAITEPDTLDDWRTGAMVPGCRVTAAGTTRQTLADAARLFYEDLRAAGWTRTPDPRDAPNEASLRFRMEGSDCLFNFYSGGLLGTESEGIVDEQAVPVQGERRYNFLVLCMEAREAAPRSSVLLDQRASNRPAPAG